MENNMPQIMLLSQETIDKIAAGEVVERPSSVVKELVENAIDAKATAITVEIKEGGISFIRITDNGCGIEREQIPLAFLRHSTSKIKSVEDLFGITSLGFRGEALSSIAAVAQVELITKTYNELTGTRYVIEGSKEKENEEIGAPDGTTFIVKNLFYNTPARRKFLKAPQTEGNYISDLMERLALSHPNISFKFINNGQTKLHTSGNAKEKDLIYHIYGREITSSLLPLKAENELFQVHGFIGKPVISRGNRNYENYFINGRYIRSTLLSKAVEEAYKGFMMQHQYPFCVLYVTMDTKLLDVNVHPTKMELRFSENEEVYHKLYQAIRDTLTHKELIPAVPVSEEKPSQKPDIGNLVPEPFERKRIKDIRSTVIKDSPYEPKYPQREKQQERAVTEKTQQLFEQTRAETVSQEIPENLAIFEQLLPKELTNTKAAETMSTGAMVPELVMEENSYQANQCTSKPKTSTETEISQKAQSKTRAEVHEIYEQQTLLEQPEATGFLTKDAKKSHRIIGQLFDTYWLVEFEDNLFMIDQHAAHEKVLYEKTMKRVRESSFTSQTLSPPVILTLDLQEEEMLERYREQITAFGYSIEHFGGKEYAINAVPAEFEDVDMKYMFMELLGDFASLNGKATPDLILEKVASMSCKAAIKGNQHISRPEMETLIEELLELENPYQCPHGRPTIISMSKYEIEKKFKRIV
jgi:DNA mismatch repair protein MutL